MSDDNVGKFQSLFKQDLRSLLRESLSFPTTFPIVFSNDAEVAIVGEAHFGSGRPYRRFLVFLYLFFSPSSFSQGVTIGTGLGSCFIDQGSPVTKGEEVPENGWLWNIPILSGSSKEENADNVYSARGLAARFLNAGVSKSLEECSALARKGLNSFSFTSFRKFCSFLGNEKLATIFSEFGKDLFSFLSLFAKRFKAEAIVVCGGVSSSFDLLAASYGSGIVREAGVRVVAGELGRKAALLGAAQRIFCRNDEE